MEETEEKKGEKHSAVKISRTITIGIFMLVFILSALVTYLSYREFSAIIKQRFSEELAETKTMAFTLINWETVEKYTGNPVEDDSYRETAQMLKDLTRAMGCSSIYVVGIDPETLESVYLFYASIEDYTGSTYKLGEVDNDQDSISQEYGELIKELIENGDWDDYLRYTAGRETYMLSAAAIKDSNGRTVGLLGVEKSMSALLADLNSLRTKAFVFTALLAVVISLFYANYMNKTLIKPLQEISSEARRFSATGKPSENLRAAAKKNEIGLLANSLLKMEAELDSYITNLSQITAEKERIGAELGIAAHIQADLLPSTFPPFPDRPELDVYASMTPAKEVGGDFYDFFLVDADRLAMVVADVSGKGVPAALFMMISRTLINQRAINAGGTPADILSYVNDQLCTNNKADQFVTVWLGILDLRTGKVTASNAGHEYPVLRGPDGVFRMIKDRHSPPLAAMPGIPRSSYEFEMVPGDCLFLYTDGVPEATNSNKELLGMDRMIEILNRKPQAGPMELLNFVKSEIDAFAGSAEQFDDITMLAVEFRGQLKQQ